MQGLYIQTRETLSNPELERILRTSLEQSASVESPNDHMTRIDVRKTESGARPEFIVEQYRSGSAASRHRVVIHWGCIYSETLPEDFAQRVKSELDYQEIKYKDKTQELPQNQTLKRRAA